METEKKETKKAKPKNQKKTTGTSKAEAVQALETAKQLGPLIGIDVETMLKMPELVKAQQQQIGVIAQKMDEIYSYFNQQVKPALAKNPAAADSNPEYPLISQSPDYYGEGEGKPKTNWLIDMIKKVDPNKAIDAFTDKKASKLTLKIAESIESKITEHVSKYVARLLEDIGKKEFMEKLEK